jgi:hypothetical protein
MSFVCKGLGCPGHDKDNLIHGYLLQIWDHGVDIYTLIHKMEDGSFFSDPH